jgi:hypothetical protein
MQEVRERSTKYLTVEFLDKTGAPAVPSAVSYRVDCLTTGQQVRADTPLTPAASVEITLTPADNAILGGNVLETRRVTVVAQYGGAGDQAVDEYDYLVRNVRGIT